MIPHATPRNTSHISSTLSILEYHTRDDAERAVKELDNRDLRGQPVRVALDAEVSPVNRSRPTPHCLIYR